MSDSLADLEGGRANVPARIAQLGDLRSGSRTGTGGRCGSYWNPIKSTLASKRIPRAMNLYRFVLGIVLGIYMGLPRLNQLRFIARDPILTGILKVAKLPAQSTFWRFLNALHLNVAETREYVWASRATATAPRANQSVIIYGMCMRPCRRA